MISELLGSLLVPLGPGLHLPLLPGRHLGLLLGCLALPHWLGEGGAVPGEGLARLVVTKLVAMVGSLGGADLACLATSSTSMACTLFTILWNQTGLWHWPSNYPPLDEIWRNGDTR